MFHVLVTVMLGSLFCLLAVAVVVAIVLFLDAIDEETRPWN